MCSLVFHSSRMNFPVSEFNLDARVLLILECFNGKKIDYSNRGRREGEKATKTAPNVGGFDLIHFYVIFNEYDFNLIGR